MEENSYINKNYPVYFSYAGNKDGNSELEKPIEELRKLLCKAKIDYRDYKVEGKTPFTYRRPMMESEEEIGRGHLIVVVLSVSYIESSHCMYEWYNIVHNPDFEKRIFPIYLEDLRDRLNDPVRTKMLDVTLTKMFEEIAFKEADRTVLSNEEKFILSLGNKAFKNELKKIIEYYRNNSVPKLERFDYEVLFKQIQDRIKELEPSTMDSLDEPSPKTVVEKQDSAPPSKIPTQSNGYCLTSPPSDADASNVIGREDDLEKLWKKLSEKKHVMLTGLGGIGKTKLAQMLFHNYRDRFEEVAWIKYKDDLRHSFSYHIEKYQNVNDPWEAMMNDLHNDGKKKLFIIDNVDDDADQRPENDKELRALTGWDNTTILLTSRLDGLSPYILHELKELGKDDCKAVFNHYYGGNEPDAELVGKIVKLANYHTLTIELLAKGARRENLESYYEKIKNGFETVLRKMGTEHHDGNATIEAHLKILFDLQQRSETDKKVLNSFAVLPVNCECSLEEIEQWFGFGNEDLDEVIKDGWLSFDKKKQTFSMHPLIRTIIRFDFLKDGQGKKTIAPDGTTDKILEYFDEHRNLGLFDINKGFVSLQRMIGIVEAVISAVDEKESVRLARLYHRIGWSYKDLGDYNKALEYYGKALKIKESKLGKDHPDTAATYNNIAMVYDAKGDYDMALVYYGMTKDIVESKLGKDHPDTATTYNNIALAHHAKGDYDMALEYFKKALEISESKLGNDHPDTATTYNNIALAHHAKGDYDKALEYYEKDRKISESKLGKDHPDTATTYNNMAGVYRAKGDYDKALEYYGKALEIRESKLGKDHPETASTYNNIALVYKAKGDYGKALEYYLKALRIWLNRDVNHPNAKIIFKNFTKCYRKANMGKAMDEWMKERLNEEEWAAYLELKGL